jgi:2-(1,2-epoxy-1,2-dihydrophenyl)acetyl-CoA isomerase
LNIRELENMKYFLVDKAEGVATLTMNRPEKFNAFNWEMEHELFEALEQIERDKDVRVLVITGAGAAFCAGADFEEMFQQSIDTGGLSEEAHFDTPLRNMVPTIAAINGVAVGAGMSIALSCDIRVASEDARMSLAYVRVGLGLEGGLSYLIPRLVGIDKACELLFTGRTIDAREAKELGLVTKVVPAAELKETVHKLARTIAQGPPLAMKAVKRGIYNALEASIRDAAEYDKSVLMELVKTDDHKEAVKAFMEKRKPLFKGK